MERVSLKEAVKFHGHLGPYLVLGLLAGKLALRKLRCKKYFGLEAYVYGAGQKPRSCLIDGLQLSCGATYGKGNIYKLNGEVMKVKFKNKLNQRKLLLTFKTDLLKELEQAKTHSDSELLAKKLYRTKFSQLFHLQLIPRSYSSGSRRNRKANPAFGAT